MKKNSIIKLFFIFIILLVPVIILSAVIGDVDSNGKVGASDYLLIRKHILGTSKLTGDKLTRADVNSDGKVNSSDYILIRKAIINGTAVATPTTNKEDIEAYFLNTYNRSSFSTTYSGNDAFIFKTSDGKYVLLDTGVESKEIKNAIYDKLKELQKKSTVTIDYMIISHMHSDHYGNANSIINDSKFKIKTLILKKEKHTSVDMEELFITPAKKKGITVIDTTSLKEGTYYNLSKSNNIKMYLFNVKDIYASEKCDKSDYVLAFANGEKDEKFARTRDNKYIYFSGADYIKNGNKTKFYTSSKIEKAANNEKYKINGRFYVSLVKDGQQRNQCSSNANSIAVLFQINTTKGNKYMYIPNDIENNGYNPFGEYDSAYGKTIHGYAPTYFYKYELYNGEPRVVVQNNQLVKSVTVTPVKKASAYKTALTIKNKFSDLIGNIAVYQSPHHGLNNYEEVVNLLNLNNKSIYVITPVGGKPENNTAFHQANSVYLLKQVSDNSRLLYGGGKSNQGVKCAVKYNGGTTTCAYYK